MKMIGLVFIATESGWSVSRLKLLVYTKLKKETLVRKEKLLMITKGSPSYSCRAVLSIINERIERIFPVSWIKWVASFLSLCLSAGLLVVNLAVAEEIASPPTVGIGGLGVHPGKVEKQFEEPSTPKSEAPPLWIPEGSRSSGDKIFEKIKLTLDKVVWKKIPEKLIFSDDELQEEYTDLIGKEVSLAEVYKIAEKITKKYRDAGYVISRAMVPDQHISKENGIVQITVVEGFVKRVVIEKINVATENSKYSVAGVKRRIRHYTDNITASKPLDIRALERYLLLVNDLSGITAKAVLQPSQKTLGATDLVLKVDFDPNSFSASLDNMGTKIVGPGEFGVKANFNSLADYASKLQISTVIASPFKKRKNLRYGNMLLRVPIGDEGFNLKMESTVSHVQPTGRLITLEFDGNTQTFLIGGEYPAVRERNINLFLEGGLKLSHAKVSVLGRSFNDDILRKLYTKLSFDMIDAWSGTNMMMFQVHHGIDFWSATKLDALLSSRPEASPVFMKVEGELSRWQALPYGFSVLAAAMWQYSSSPLFSSEEMGVGGTKYGRGYDLGDIAGDKGIAQKVEIQHNSQFYDFLKLQSYLFFDYGRVWNLDDVDAGTDTESEELISSGFGIRSRESIGKIMDFEVYLAKPFAKSPINIGNNNIRYFGRIAFNF